MKPILVLIVIMGMVSYAFVVMTATPSDKDEYEAYMRYKERRHGRMDKEK